MPPRCAKESPGATCGLRGSISPSDVRELFLFTYFKALFNRVKGTKDFFFFTLKIHLNLEASFIIMEQQGKYARNFY